MINFDLKNKKGVKFSHDTFYLFKLFQQLYLPSFFRVLSGKFF